MTGIDLTPFGFTPTESLAYQALAERGPLSGYALARELSIARANAYQALHGLAAKGAVRPTAERPQRFRPVQPAALFALLVEKEASKLDRLETQLMRGPSAAAPGLVPITSERALLDLLLRTAAKTSAQVSCVAPASLLWGLAPAWHKRAADGTPTSLWCLGDPPAAALPIPLSGNVDPSRAERYFGASGITLVTDEVGVIARLPGGTPSGYWTSDSVLVGSIRGLTDKLVAE